MNAMTRRFFCALAILALIGCAKSPTAPSKNTVLYSVTGTAKHVSLTYQNSTGGTNQQGSALPFTYTWSGAKTGDFLYISAQIDTSPDPGSISVTISKNDSVVYSATAIGFANIATASGSY